MLVRVLSGAGRWRFPKLTYAAAMTSDDGLGLRPQRASALAWILEQQTTHEGEVDPAVDGRLYDDHIAELVVVLESCQRRPGVSCRKKYCPPPGSEGRGRRVILDS